MGLCTHWVLVKFRSGIFVCLGTAKWQKIAKIICKYFCKKLFFQSSWRAAEGQLPADLKKHFFWGLLMSNHVRRHFGPRVFADFSVRQKVAKVGGSAISYDHLVNWDGLPMLVSTPVQRPLVKWGSYDVSPQRLKLGSRWVLRVIG